MAEISMREAYGRALADYGALNLNVVALDVDTASYTLTRSYLMDQQVFPCCFPWLHSHLTAGC